MSEPQDGGPAFPQSVPAGVIGSGCGPYVEWGMSLRDYLATHAMAAFIAAPIGKYPHQKELGRVASDAYDSADAMLAARERNGGAA